MTMSRTRYTSRPGDLPGVARRSCALDVRRIAWNQWSYVPPNVLCALFMAPLIKHRRVDVMGDTRILSDKAKQLCMNAQQIGTAVGRTYSLERTRRSRSGSVKQSLALAPRSRGSRSVPR